VPDGTPGESVKCIPPHPLTSIGVQVGPIAWLAGEQVCMQFAFE
jgi:hypothetical protein